VGGILWGGWVVGGGGGGGVVLGCGNRVLAEGKMGEDLGVVWGLNSTVRRPLVNLLLLLTETVNMKPNGNEKKVKILYRYLE